WPGVFLRYRHALQGLEPALELARRKPGCISRKRALGGLFKATGPEAADQAPHRLKCRTGQSGLGLKGMAPGATSRRWLRGFSSNIRTSGHRGRGDGGCRGRLPGRFATGFSFTQVTTEIQVRQNSLTDQNLIELFIQGADL